MSKHSNDRLQGTLVPILDPQTMERFFAARVAGFGGIMVKLAGGMGFMGVTLSSPASTGWCRTA